ncbi:MAG: CHC2 zinc finger domain-containing protein [Alphaproteobacteria bacterium]
MIIHKKEKTLPSRNIFSITDSNYRIKISSSQIETAKGKQLEVFQREFNIKFPSRQQSQVLCCFHLEKHPSLSLNLRTGQFFCHSCGAKGGDVISFIKQKYNLNFIESVKKILGEY